MSEKLKALREHGKWLKRCRENPTEKNWERCTIAWERYLTLSAQMELKLQEEGAPEDGGPENGSESP